MTEYKYQEEDYISPKDYSHFNETLENCDWDPNSIEDDHERQLLLNYLTSLIVRAPLFLSAYEYILSMIDTQDTDDDKALELMVDVECNWFKACLQVAEKDYVYEKLVSYKLQENRPLLRGLNNGAEVMWMVEDLEDAYALFNKLIEMDPEDMMGARFCAKAIYEKMPYEVFEARFTYEEDFEKCFRMEELEKWYAEN